ncbi:MDR family MFS transporter [Rhodopila sp.]|jgi:EmrB/QacA subfamily drug resistance transporter|uniref:MDR family MFS transporter n=1 Tax=Rhodopila sp. TaxID=2480087 RepID=UPI002B715AC6|nr:MDR family MFS transporter [Rhodopila sp.]HVZ07328.1 MDR family MFS transporter [Rhodopila sp.]
MATFMAAVESTIVATAMPTIVADLGGFNLFSWVFAVYLLTQAVTIPVYGRLADVYGRKRVFYAGAGLFLVGSTLCGFAPSMVWLIAARALQGCGAGGVQPIAMTICGDIYTPAERARVQGLISSVFGIAAVAGPSLGAWLVEHAAWQIVFWVNLPIGAAAIVMIASFLTETVERKPHRVDVLGSVLLAIGIGALMLALIQRADFGPWMTASVIAAGLLALGVLVAHESRTPEPMLMGSLLRERVILIGSVGSGLAGAVMMGISAFLPTYVQGAMGHSAMMAGLVLGAMSVTWALASIFGGRIMVRTTYRLAAVAGALALVAGCTWLVLMTPERGVAWATAGSLVIGVGMGCCNTAFIVSIQAAVPWNRRGAATGWCLFLRFIGQAMGAASFGAVLNATIAARLPEAAHMLDHLLEPAQRAMLPAAKRAALVEVVAAGLHNAYWLGIGLSIVLLALVSCLPPRLSPAGQPLR